MTIALGILAGNSQILAADTQISANPEKFSQGKIHYLWHAPTSEYEAGMVTITGAGDSAYLHALQQEMSQAFKGCTVESMDEVGDAFGKALKRFYKEHVVALGLPRDDRPEVELIIAARRGIASRTWVSSKNRLNVVESGSVAVGIGAVYAQSVLDNLAIVPYSIETAMLAAAYVAFLVKLRNLWVGMDTQIVRVDKAEMPFPVVWNAGLCRRLEEEFRLYTIVEARLVHSIFGSGFYRCDAASVMSDVENLRKRVANIIPPTAPLNQQPPKLDPSSPPPSPESLGGSDES